MSKYSIERWEPENPDFWAGGGRYIALRNLVFSVFAEFLAFSVWQVWSATTVKLNQIGFNFSDNQLFWLAAVPGLTGATLRIPYAFMVPIFGGRNWTLVSTALLLLPSIGIGMAVQDPNTPYSTFIILALLCGFGGGNFASSMANINFFFPKRRKGFALGLNAAGGNIGVSIVQFTVPIVIAYQAFGSLGGPAQTIVTKAGATQSIWLQNAAYIWVPFILVSLFTTFFLMNNLHVARASVKEQFSVFNNKHAWLMSILYVGTFGSFIGYAAGFPLLIKSQFPNIDPLKYAFLGPLVGSLIRPAGGWLSDKVGGSTVTFWNFIVMALAVVGVLHFLGHKGDPGAFLGFFSMFMILFTTSGIGNGSTYRMLPLIFIERNHLKAKNGECSHDEAMSRANKESGAVVGITSAFGAFGAFFIPKSFGTSIEMTGGPQAALIAFIGFYVVCIAITWWHYHRKNAEVRC